MTGAELMILTKNRAKRKEKIGCRNHLMQLGSLGAEDDAGLIGVSVAGRDGDKSCAEERESI